MIAILSSMPYGQAKPIFTNISSDYYDILPTIGNNAGNLLFHYASSILTAEPIIFVERGTEDNVYRYISRHSKALIIPTANLLNESVPVGPAFLRIISTCECPIVMLGLGLQALRSKPVNQIELPSQTIQFLRTLSEKASLVCCRGEKTLQLCSKYTDVSKFYALGCPSILISSDLNLGGTLQHKLDATKNIISQGLTPKVTYTVGNIIKFIRQLKLNEYSRQSVLFEQAMILEAITNPHWNVVFQNEAFLFEALEKYKTQRLKTIASILSNMSIPIPEIKKTILNLESKTFELRLKYYLSAREWITDLSNSDIAISQRVHGTMAAINAGVPALCVYHDARTEELCKTMGVPSCSIEIMMSNINSSNPLESIMRVMEMFDFESLNMARKTYANTLMTAFKSLGIKPSSLLSSIANA